MSISPDPAATSKQPRRALRVLVTGSRDWNDPFVIDATLDTLARRAALTVVHGDCPRGADFITARWAREMVTYGHKQEPHPADWRRHGKRAGFIRNGEMVRLGADLCIAFIRNNSHGATDCATRAEVVEIPTIVFRQSYPDLTQVADALAMVGAPCG